MLRAWRMRNSEYSKLLHFSSLDKLGAPRVLCGVGNVNYPSTLLTPSPTLSTIRTRIH